MVDNKNKKISQTQFFKKENIVKPMTPAEVVYWERFYTINKHLIVYKYPTVKSISLMLLYEDHYVNPDLSVLPFNLWFKREWQRDSSAILEQVEEKDFILIPDLDRDSSGYPSDTLRNYFLDHYATPVIKNLLCARVMTYRDGIEPLKKLISLLKSLYDYDGIHIRNDCSDAALKKLEEILDLEDLLDRYIEFYESVTKHAWQYYGKRTYDYRLEKHRRTKERIWRAKEAKRYEIATKAKRMPVIIEKDLLAKKDIVIYQESPIGNVT